MAAPHVCGMGAYLIGLEGIQASQACNRVKELAQPSITKPGPDTTNKLLYNGNGA